MIVTGMRLRAEMMRALMRQSATDGKCTCPSGGTQMYYEHDGVPQGEKPSDRCENCGGRVQLFCVNFVSDWRNG